MDANGLTQLVLALAVVAGALWGFNSLVGKGPRGAVWLLAACLFTWASMLPFALRDPDDLSLTKNAALLVLIFRACGAVGIAVGLFDLWQKRTTHEPHPIADFVLKQPATWGAVMGINFFALLFQGAIHSALLERYCASHTIEIIVLNVFFIGLAALILRVLDIAGQFPTLNLELLSPIPAGGNTVGDCTALLAQLEERPAIRESFLVRRLHDALDFVLRKNSADDLEPHLRHLEEVESMRVNGAYAMVRIIIWAIPILGLLGTVIGITIAVANLNPETLEESMTKVTHGLGVAFDHTATALSFTMLLMFTKAGVERVEDSLLGKVDDRVSRELVGRFQQTGTGDDPNVDAIRRMTGQVVVAIETLAGRQAEIWKSTIDGAHQQWTDMSVGAVRTLRDSFSNAVKDGIDRHTQSFNQGAQQHVERLISSTAQHAEQLDRSSRTTSERLREGLEKLAELLIDALERHGEVLTASEKEMAAENRQHLSEVETALGAAMVNASERQERLINQSENLLKEMQIALVEAAGATVEQQEQLVRQGDILLKVVDATGQIQRLEDSLSQNLSTVQRAHNFEEMAINLSAAIQLLSARLGQPFGVRSREVAGGDAASQAA
ncbi:MAG TPA: MotA/TolQ/ExbB proton channel family protein [Lacipirellulaceae bacterium]|jgi:biopolymer transport protein ExbB/TolQ|nr:MotA/TolQ/ExbB proton channel family protein [Lacipirellulaceae bacterium]